VTPSLRAKALREWQPYAADPIALTSRAASLHRLIPGVVKGLGLEQRLQHSQVFHLWTQIVGADIARHAQPVSLRQGTLVVSVDHPVWLNELSRYQRPLILKKLQAAAGPGAVKQLTFRIG
jgi:predicted nucleic acid-binding Zn ribbon protein